MPIRGMMEGAMLAALTAVLALLGVFIPPFSLLTNLIWTIPIVVAIARNGWTVGVVTLAAAITVIALMAGISTALILLIQFGGLGLIYGIAFRHGWSTIRAFFGGAVVVALSFVAFLALFFVLTGLTPESLSQQVDSIPNAVIEMYRSAGLFEKYGEQGVTEESVRVLFSSIILFFKQMFPSILVTYAMLTAATNLLLSRWMLRRIGQPVTAQPPFREWRLPWQAVWVVIAGLAAALAGDYWQIPALGTAGINVLYICYPVLLILGFAVVAYLLNKYVLSPFVLSIVAVLIFLFPSLALTFVATVGLFDLVFDYRAKMDKIQGA
ncbi:DUF2232 domain-containing protein [Heliobacterium gestii]|uniref:DUF2232 domain-containing protein n=1 Tax=Heliomicrobium gestii TaxID=2699 RepID=A0A845LDD2_HELGE|nr:YybS family protein [Heliomicrobium gestii]MBM7867805.1 uncharacterized protein YybS (DUF2232 family) [Heliomicrobium gestii]MZP44198.1 DUF2232 domain-containing protein [Heliomicrobium gestii]